MVSLVGGLDDMKVNLISFILVDIGSSVLGS